MLVFANDPLVITSPEYGDTKNLSRPDDGLALTKLYLILPKSPCNSS